jgi:hypothetical protein
MKFSSSAIPSPKKKRVTKTLLEGHRPVCAGHRHRQRKFRIDPFLIVQDRSENAGRVKLWVAVPVDRAVYAHQGNHAHVADDSVIFDRLIRHFSVSSLGSEMG